MQSKAPPRLRGKPLRAPRFPHARPTGQPIPRGRCGAWAHGLAPLPRCPSRDAESHTCQRPRTLRRGPRRGPLQPSSPRGQLDGRQQVAGSQRPASVTAPAPTGGPGAARHQGSRSCGPALVSSQRRRRQNPARGLRLSLTGDADVDCCVAPRSPTVSPEPRGRGRRVTRTRLSSPPQDRARGRSRAPSGCHRAQAAANTGEGLSLEATPRTPKHTRGGADGRGGPGATASETRPLKTGGEGEGREGPCEAL